MKQIFPTLADIESAAKCIGPHIPKTPVFRSDVLNTIAGADINFKMENLNKCGAFKVRGALKVVLSLSASERTNGVVTHSSGNHGQALAWSAQKVGIPAYIVMPSNAKEIKKRGVRELGGTIIECEPNKFRREEKMNDVQRETGATIVHPYNDNRIISGQATAGREFLFQTNKDLDVIIAPVGGGGLLSGTALAAHYLFPKTKVIGAEPEGADDAYRSMQAGSIQTNESVNTIADGLLTNLGDKTFPIIQRFVDRIILVSDEEIIAAMRMLWERLRTIVEPSSAVAFAAVLKERKRFAGKKVGIILSGGNVDLDEVCGLMKK